MPSSCSKTKQTFPKRGNPIQQVLEPFEPPYESPLWEKSESMASVELFSNNLDSGLTEVFKSLEDKSPYKFFCYN